MKPAITVGTVLPIGTVVRINRTNVTVNFKGTITDASFKACENIFDAIRK